MYSNDHDMARKSNKPLWWGDTRRRWLFRPSCFVRCVVLWFGFGAKKLFEVEKMAMTREGWAWQGNIEVRLFSYCGSATKTHIFMTYRFFGQCTNPVSDLLLLHRKPLVAAPLPLETSSLVPYHIADRFYGSQVRAWHPHFGGMLDPKDPHRCGCLL